METQELFIYQLHEFPHPITWISEIMETFPSVMFSFLGIKALMTHQMGTGLVLYWEGKPVDQFAFVSPSRNFGLFN